MRFILVPQACTVISTQGEIYTVNYKQNIARPLVGISQCLLGDAVRYDGKAKPNQTVLTHLSKIFHLIPVCPEVEAGLGIPRPPVQLTGDTENPELIGRDDPSINITRIMQVYCETRPAELSHLDGFIFKSRSPSCGLNSTPVFINRRCISETASGMFARALCRRYPKLSVIDENDLNNQEQLNNFLNKVLPQIK